MAYHNQKITTGCRFWWKDKSPYIWVELGKKKAAAFCANNEIGKTFLLIIPPPWGEMAWALAHHITSEIKKNVGKNGLWIKFGLQGYVKSKKRTDKNKQKHPKPW